MQKTIAQRKALAFCPMKCNGLKLTWESLFPLEIIRRNNIIESIPLTAFLSHFRKFSLFTLLLVIINTWNSLWNFFSPELFNFWFFTSCFYDGERSNKMSNTIDFVTHSARLAAPKIKTCHKIHLCGQNKLRSFKINSIQTGYTFARSHSQIPS